MHGPFCAEAYGFSIERYIAGVKMIVKKREVFFLDERYAHVRDIGSEHVRLPSWMLRLRP
jgi:hypothetical protein